MNRNDKETLILGGWLIFAIILVWFAFFTRSYDGEAYFGAILLTGILSLCIAVLLCIWIEEREKSDIKKLRERLSNERRKIRQYESEIRKYKRKLSEQEK